MGINQEIYRIIRRLFEKVYRNSTGQDSCFDILSKRRGMSFCQRGWDLNQGIQDNMWYKMYFCQSGWDLPVQDAHRQPKSLPGQKSNLKLQKYDFTLIPFTIKKSSVNKCVTKDYRKKIYRFVFLANLMIFLSSSLILELQVRVDFVDTEMLSPTSGDCNNALNTSI